jgi:NAD-dependent DNA ligase
MKINQTFATPLRTLNIDSSSFGKSAHATNFAQVEHKELKSLTKTHTKKSLHNFHTRVKKLGATQNIRYKRRIQDKN